MIDFNFVQRNLPVFMEGLQTTLVLSLLAFLLALAWGLLVVAARLSRLGSLRFLALAFVELMRNTPVLVQMYFIFFGSAVLGYPLTGFVAGLIALTLQNGAYLSEVYRGGIEAVSRRQAEAGLALGMLERQAFRIVVLPQAVRRIIPPIANQGVVIIKDTSLVATLSVAELMYHARLLADRTAAAYEVFLTLAVFYLAITTIFTLLMRLIEWRVRIVD
jgi:His/Glu/Gln/Arg/opine family amino acid ABC transporter permease subunit